MSSSGARVRRDGTGGRMPPGRMRREAEVAAGVGVVRNQQVA
eukprot:gene12934-9092_t